MPCLLCSTAVAEAAEWIACREGATLVFHYLNDYLVLGSADTLECSGNLTILLSMFDSLGIPVAMENWKAPPLH